MKKKIIIAVIVVVVLVAAFVMTKKYYQGRVRQAYGEDTDLKGKGIGELRKMLRAWEDKNKKP